MYKKIYLIGDFESNTGPAIANKALRKSLGNRAKFSRARTKIGRILEIVKATAVSDVLCFCGFSELNKYGIIIAKLFRKKSAYLMHGYIELEAKINQITINPKRVEKEYYILENADIILCVSNLLANKVKEKFPKRDNVYVLYNIVNKPKQKKNIERNKLQIMSTGGGMPQKNNLVVCEAIKKINCGLPKDKQLKYIIAGKAYGQEENFKKYDFVDFVGDISRDECLRLMGESQLYIQNSSFETFGLALVEAAGCGCDLVISQNIGAIDVIANMQNEKIVDRTDSVDEVATKIKYAMSMKNETIISWGEISSTKIARVFLKILEGKNNE